MTNSVVTPDQLEELTRMGSAIEVVNHILHREYEWKTMRYFCDYGDRGWVISKIEPRIVFTPEPPSIVQRIIDIVEAGRAKTNGGARNSRSNLAAYSAIIDLLQNEGLIAP